jgi:hypothetical protein
MTLVRPTSVRLSSNSRWTIRSSPAVLRFDVLRLDVLRIVILRPAILHPVVLRIVSPSYLFIQHLFELCLIFVRCSLDVRLTSVRSLCVMGHSQQRTVFFKFVVGATRGRWLEGSYVLTLLPTNRARIRRVRRSLEEQD